MYIHLKCMTHGKSPTKFLWDDGNLDKNYRKHGVANAEAEEVFFDPNKKILKDSLHSHTETRFILLGQTYRNRLLFVVFTSRRGHIRIISARDINQKERRLYEEAA